MINNEKIKDLVNEMLQGDWKFQSGQDDCQFIQDNLFDNTWKCQLVRDCTTKFEVIHGMCHFLLEMARAGYQERINEMEVLELERMKKL